MFEEQSENQRLEEQPKVMFEEQSENKRLEEQPVTKRFEEWAGAEY